MECPQCRQKCVTRMSKAVEDGRERTYVCQCGYAFDTFERIYRVRSPEQRRKYFSGDPLARSLAQKAKAISRVAGWKKI